jgi:hypothetical protein
VVVLTLIAALRIDFEGSVFYDFEGKLSETESTTKVKILTVSQVSRKCIGPSHMALQRHTCYFEALFLVKNSISD